MKLNERVITLLLHRWRRKHPDRALEVRVDHRGVLMRQRRRKAG